MAAAMGKAPPVTSVAAGAAALGLTMGGVMQAVGVRAAVTAPPVPVRLPGSIMGVRIGFGRFAFLVRRTDMLVCRTNMLLRVRNCFCWVFCLFFLRVCGFVGVDIDVGVGVGVNTLIRRPRVVDDHTAGLQRCWSGREKGNHVLLCRA